MGKIIKNGIEYGGTGTIDTELSLSSKNPVQNKTVTQALNTKADKSTTYTKTETDALLDELKTNVLLDELKPEILSLSAWNNLTTKTAPFYFVYDDS